MTTNRVSEFKKSINDIKAVKVFLLGVILVTFFTYANSIRGEFVTADDIPGIVQNPLTQNFMGSLKTLNLNTIKNAAIFQLAGMNSSAFHFVSIIVHLINIVLVYVFALSVTKKDLAAKIATLLFALHPVNTEANMWISGSPYAIGATFFLLVAIPFTWYKKTDDIKYFAISFAMFLVTIINDRGAWPLVIPAVMFVLDQFVLSEKPNFKKGVLLITPFVLVSAVSAYVIIGTNYHNRAEDLSKQYYFNPEGAPPLLNRLPFTIYGATKNLVFPYELNIYPGEKPLTWNIYKIMCIVTLFLGGLIIYLYAKNKYYMGLILAIIASIGPTLSPIQVSWLMTERYLYIGSIFFAILLSLILITIKDRNEEIFKWSFGLIIALYAVRIIFRSQDWVTNKGLWLSTLRFSTDSYRVYNNLGDVYMKEGNYDKAIESFKKSFEIFPGYADAMHNAGLVYLVKNDLENAHKYLLMAVQTKPTLVPAIEKLGLIYYQDKQFDVAYEYFSKALELNPNSELAAQGVQATQEEVAKQEAE